jgi:glucose-6-phosphate 1-dehydrogenase
MSVEMIAGGGATDEQPVRAAVTGLGHGKRPDPCVIVIFGASGDLTRRELVPSLFELDAQDLLPESFAVVGFSTRPWDDATFRETMREAVQDRCRFDADRWRRFAPCLHYVSGDFRSAPDEGYRALQTKIAAVRAERHIPDNLLFHLATPPAFFEVIAQRIEAAGLARGVGWRRLVIEKPFGVDAASARELDAKIRAVFQESQIYRIDHFLGKETVQNMLVVRFANPSFEPIWNRNYIDHVQITVAEDIGIGTRAKFYEKTGVVRDMVQNHLLQLLCMTAIEPPGRFDGTALRNETVKVLDAICRVDPDRDCVQGQYGPGEVRGESVAGYREEDGVAATSRTNTYAAVKLMVDNWRWAGVPFYLRTGKRMESRLTEVAIQFKPTPHLMFPVDKTALGSNLLVFRLQPEEGILQTFMAKHPGPELHMETVNMSFRYATAFGITEMPRAYAWLLLDAMEGDQTLFSRADWIARAWEIVDPIIARFAEQSRVDFPNYPAGSPGPQAAAELLAADGRAWRPLAAE